MSGRRLRSRVAGYRSQVTAVILVFYSVMGSLWTGFLGAVPLKVLRSHVGGINFWLINLGIVALAISGQWFALAYCHAIASVIVGFQVQAENQNYSRFVVLAGSMLVGFAITAALLALWAFWEQRSVLSVLWQVFDPIREQFDKLTRNQISEEQISSGLDQLPSLFFLFLGVVASSASFMENWLRRQLNLQIRPAESLGRFCLPDLMIWTVIIGAAFGFIQLGQPALERFGLNLFNVSLFFYYFQGLAVTHVFLHVMKVKSGWRWLIYFLVTMQLLPGVAALGIMDYWINFRGRLLRSRGGSELSKSGRSS